MMLTFLIGAVIGACAGFIISGLLLGSRRDE